MDLYRGALDDRHWRAVIRASLRSHGFSICRQDFDQVTSRCWEKGCHLREQTFPNNFPPFYSSTDYRLLSQTEPHLWERIAGTAGMGYRQASVLHFLAGGSAALSERVSFLGALFNAGIALLDSLADAAGKNALSFELLNEDVINSLFRRTTQNEESLLAQLYTKNSDPKVGLLLTIMAMWGTGVGALYEHSRNHQAWEDLFRLTQRMYEAQRSVSRTRKYTPHDLCTLARDIEAKSMLPTMALLQISALADALPQKSSKAARRVAGTLGRVIFLVDDLVDLLADLRSGAVNGIEAKLRNIIENQNRRWASDADLYAILDDTVAEIVNLLSHPSILFYEKQALPEFGRPPRCETTVLDFVRYVVAGWVGWQEESSEVKRRCLAPRTVRDTKGSVVRRTIEFILFQQREDYSEAIHLLIFPCLSPHGLRYESHPTVLYQRAILLDSLLDAQAAGHSIPPQVVNTEVMKILRSKHRTVRGGWNYVPEVQELPPDADDLGIVLQVLVRAGGRELASTCDEPIRLALDAQEANGGIPTWVLDPRSKSEAEMNISCYLKVVNGWGSHADVVANLALGLTLYDSSRYRLPLRRVASYLENQQDGRGAWQSRWYEDSYYGTYRATAALGRLQSKSLVLERAQEFLLQGQHSTGGWSKENQCPLSTALAILALATFSKKCLQPAIDGGIRYLIKTQDKDGGWPASPFISFETSDGSRTYKSRTLTTAFCLKAFLVSTQF